MRKLTVSCDHAFVEKLDYAANAAGTSRAKFMRSVLDAASDAVCEREKLFADFEAYVQASGLRARAYFK